MTYLSKHDLSTVRKDNLRRIADAHGGPSALSAKLGYANASFLVQMIGPNPSRSVSEKTARSIEQALSLAPMSIDQPSGETVPGALLPSAVGITLHADTIATALEAVAKACEETHTKLSTNKFADVVAFVYREMADNKRPPDLDSLKRLILLAR